MELKIEVPVVVTPKPSDMAIVREALLKAIILLKACEWPDDAPMQDITEVMDEIEKALSAPPRNCDVGDAADWEKRFGEECDKGHTCSDCPVRHAKTKMAIELDKGARCEFIWAKMPYEEGGAK